MLDENALDFDGTNPDAAHFNHVVRASGIPEISLCILVILIPGAQPMAGNSLLRFFVLVPITGAGGIGFDEQIADLALSNRLIVVVDDFGVEAGNKFSAGTGPHSVRRV